MKKLVLTLSIFFSFIGMVKSQDISDHALGIRVGDNDGFGAEISYQRALKENTRLEVDLGFRDHDHSEAFKLTALHQWVWVIDNRFNWYAGFGAGVGSWSWDNDFPGNDDDDGFFLNVDGVVGVEYDFEIPLLISLDFRPEFNITGDYGDDTDFDIALSIRYQF